jgi:hypothetical protein
VADDARVGLGDTHLPAIAAALLLTGCSVGTDPEGRDRPAVVMVHSVDLRDGRRVLCVFER